MTMIAIIQCRDCDYYDSENCKCTKIYEKGFLLMPDDYCMRKGQAFNIPMCKDCKHYVVSGMFHECELLDYGFVEENDFCSKGVYSNE